MHGGGPDQHSATRPQGACTAHTRLLPPQLCGTHTKPNQLHPICLRSCLCVPCGHSHHGHASQGDVASVSCSPGSLCPCESNSPPPPTHPLSVFCVRCVCACACGVMAGDGVSARWHSPCGARANEEQQLGACTEHQRCFTTHCRRCVEVVEWGRGVGNEDVCGMFPWLSWDPSGRLFRCC